MNLNFFITVIFYTIILLIIHSKLKENENRSNILEPYKNKKKEVKADLPYQEIETIIPLKDVETFDDQTNQDLLKYLNLEKKESANKSNNIRLENKDLDEYFPSNSKAEYNFEAVPTQVTNSESFKDLDQSEPLDGGEQVYAFEDFETQYSTI